MVSVVQEGQGVLRGIILNPAPGPEGVPPVSLLQRQGGARSPSPESEIGSRGPCGQSNSPRPGPLAVSERAAEPRSTARRGSRGGPGGRVGKASAHPSSGSAAAFPPGRTAWLRPRESALRGFEALPLCVGTSRPRNTSRGQPLQSSSVLAPPWQRHGALAGQGERRDGLSESLAQRPQSRPRLCTSGRTLSKDSTCLSRVTEWLSEPLGRKQTGQHSAGSGAVHRGCLSRGPPGQGDWLPPWAWGGDVHKDWSLQGPASHCHRPSEGVFLLNNSTLCYVF